MEHFKAYRFDTFIMFSMDFSNDELTEFEKSDLLFVKADETQGSIRFKDGKFFINEWTEYNVIGLPGMELTAEDYYYSGRYNYHNSGVVFLSNFIGVIKFRDQVFNVESNKIETKLANKLIEDLDKRIKETISLAFKSYGTARGKFSRNEKAERDYYVYKKLYNLMRKDKLIPFFHAIRRMPNSVFDKEVERKPISLVTHFSPETIIDVISGNSILSKSNKETSLSKKFNGHIPVYLNEYNNIISNDTSENQFVKFFLNYTIIQFSNYIKDLKRIKKEDVQSTVNCVLLEEVTKMRDDVTQELSSTFYKGISKISSINSSSTILTRRYGYKQLYNEFIRIKETPINCFDSESLIDLFENKSVDKLYEYICLFRLVDILSKIYGEENLKMSRTKTTDKNYTVAISEESGGVVFKFDDNNNRFYKVELLFQQSFSRKNNEYYSMSVNLKPDFTIKIHINSKGNYNPDTVFYHFDAKFRISKYNDSKNADIAKMHSYRDAIKNTRGSYVLFPGEKKDLYPVSSGKTPYDGVGSFPLNFNQDHDEELERLLKAIVTKK